jgi:hypothetical protein
VLKNSVMAGYEAYLPIASERYGAKSLAGEYAAIAEGSASRPSAWRVPTTFGPRSPALETTRGGRPALLELITREETRLPVY